jgi:hypothetical protein
MRVSFNGTEHPAQNSRRTNVMITEAELTAALLIIIGIALQVDLFLLYPCDDKNI